MILPVPRQFGQAPCVWNMPSGVRWVCVTTPVPRQFGQVSAVVPFAAPVPPQSSQDSMRSIVISFSQPNAASSNDRITV